MKTARVSLGLAITLAWTLSSPAFAQQYLPPSQFPGQAAVNDYSPDEGVDDIHTRSLFDNRNYLIRSDAGSSVGYANGFQTIGAFQPIIVDPNEFIFWVSPRGYVTYNSGSFAGNIGSGFRWLNPANQRILGGGFWWDHDNNGTNQFDQLGVSGEYLGNFLDFRANAYYPTNQNIHVLNQFFSGNNMFIGHNIGIGRTTVSNSALRGGDFETGGALPGIGDLGFRAYAGGYYYQGPVSGGGIYGVRGRLEALITQDLWGTVIVTHDRVFGTNVSAAATLYLGSGNEQQFMRRIPMTTRLYQQQERQYRVAVQHEVETDFFLALRAGGTGGSGGPIGTPIFVEHVDNTAPAGGDGTVNHPLNFLPTTTPTFVDIIFVHRGTGTSLNMNQGTTLNNFERLLGDGAHHNFTALQGTFNLPGFTPGPFPTITNVNPGGSAVTLASHNEVSGFNITNAALNGITNTAPITDFNINDVNITGSGNSLGLFPVGAGIHLTDANGAGFILDSNINNNNAEGIRIDNGVATSGTLTLTVNNVVAQHNFTGMVLNAGQNIGTTINPTVTKSSFSNNGHDGIAISLMNGSAMIGHFDQITAVSNDIVGVSSPTFGDGFHYVSDGSTGNIVISRSSLNGNKLNGIEFTLTGGSSLATTIVNNNTTIDNNGNDGVLINGTDSTINATLLNNVINNNGNIGIEAVSKGTGAFPASFNLVAGGYATQDINGNGVLEPGENQIPIPSLGPTIIGNGVLNREGNTLLNNHGAGIAFRLVDQGTGTANIIGNIIQNTLAPNPANPTSPYQGQAIDIRLTNSNLAINSTASFTQGVVDANLIGSLTNPALGNKGGGVYVFAGENTSLENLQIGTEAPTSNPLKGNIIANNGTAAGPSDGINITRANTAQVGDVTPVTIDNNQIVNNIGNPATTTAGIQHGNGISISAIDSFDGVVNGFVISNNKIDQNQTNGILLHVEADAQMDVAIHHNDISQNGQNGIRTTEPDFTAPGDQRGIGGTWDQNTITKNTANGILLGAHSGTSLENVLIGSLVSSANGNLIQFNGQNGILIHGNGTATIAFNTIDSNASSFGTSNPLAHTSTSAGGIYINAFTTNDFTIDNNIITNNGNFAITASDGGDGIQIYDAGLATHSDGNYSVTISNNTIRNNAGRGVNIWNSIPQNQNGGTDNLVVDIENNNIKGNRLEGIYSVNTNSGDTIPFSIGGVPSNNISPALRVNDLASQPMLRDGQVNSAVRQFITVNNNDIEGNGILVQPFDFGSVRGTNLNPVSGLVIRVGTTDGGFGPFFDGGFFGEGFGGVGATVTNNVFHGNKGDDVGFSSFTSTVDPITAAGTWNTTTFAVTAYQSDPLSRLDLSFHNNVFDSAPINGGNVAQPLGPTDPTIAAAFYNDSDGTFKSRLFTAAPPGPFGSATRDRNAERLAARFLGILPPPANGTGADFFRYPGEGQSTFRLIGATTAADVAQAGFILDNSPYTSPADANGVIAPNGINTPLPYGWTFGLGSPHPQ